MENNNNLNGLDRYGFNNDLKDSDLSIFSNNLTIDLIRQEIAKYLRKTKTINNDCSSYRLKAVFEDYLNIYVTNGELIFAMNSEGYKIKRDGINGYFNVDRLSIRLLENSKNIKSLLNSPLKHSIINSIHRNKYNKFKYSFKFLIDNKFSNNMNIKKDVIKYIAISINEPYESVRNWVKLSNVDTQTIPQDKLELLSNIFNLKIEELINENF